MNIGIIGFGSVSKELIEILREVNYGIEVKGIVNSKGGILGDIDLNTLDKFKNNFDNIPGFIKGLDYKKILENNEIDTVVELTNTSMDEYSQAYYHMREALAKGKNLITGNKGPIVYHYDELLKIARKNNVKIGIGCTVGGALPSLILGEEGIAGGEVYKIEAILNGTTNYIIYSMEKGLSYIEALEKAQREGIAERNSKLDVEGLDTAIKLKIISHVVFGKSPSLEEIDITGIDGLTSVKKEKCKMKLLGKSELINGEVIMSVKPTWVNEDHTLYSVELKNKGITYYTKNLGEITLFGGSSSPRYAAGAILRDLLNINGRNSI